VVYIQTFLEIYIGLDTVAKGLYSVFGFNKSREFFAHAAAPAMLC
jgi:hypothetical protein